MRLYLRGDRSRASNDFGLDYPLLSGAIPNERTVVDGAKGPSKPDRLGAVGTNASAVSGATGILRIGLLRELSVEPKARNAAIGSDVEPAMIQRRTVLTVKMFSLLASTFYGLSLVELSSGVKASMCQTRASPFVDAGRRRFPQSQKAKRMIRHRDPSRMSSHQCIKLIVVSLAAGVGGRHISPSLLRSRFRVEEITRDIYL